MYDLVLKKGRIIDGTGNPSYKADIGIKESKIAKIGKISSNDAQEIIDAKGLIVSPGFIDAHSHDDLLLLMDPSNISKIAQGVTTTIIGNCGVSPAPVNNETLEQLKQYTSFLSLGMDIKWDWTSFGEYLNRLETLKLGVNVAALVGHGTIRIAIMDMDDRKPTWEELGRMKRILAQSMEEGAVGMSTGLTFPPGAYAGTNELIELCKVVAKYGGIYVSHIRGESWALINAVNEALEIGTKAKIPVEISHYKACGSKNWSKIKETLRIIEKARAKGIDITADQYPYTAGSIALMEILPPWAQAGGVNKLIERIQNSKERQKIKKDLEGGKDWENYATSCGWENIKIICSLKNPDLEGKSIAEISELKNKDPCDVVFDLIVEENGATLVALHEMNENGMRKIMKHPAVMVESDGVPVGVRGKAHPRLYGTFPRVLGKYVREEKVLTLKDAIRKMTSLPAWRFGIRNKGLLRKGMDADITVFNPKIVKDRATYEQPNLPPEGIEYVIVNGRVAIEKGQLTKFRSGKVLRKNKYRAL